MVGNCPALRTVQKVIRFLTVLSEIITQGIQITLCMITYVLFVIQNVGGDNDILYLIGTA